MYYYSNGRPHAKINWNHSTIFRKRPNSQDIDGNVYLKKSLKLYFRIKKLIKYLNLINFKKLLPAVFQLYIHFNFFLYLPFYFSE